MHACGHFHVGLDVAHSLQPPCDRVMKCSRKTKKKTCGLCNYILGGVRGSDQVADCINKYQRVLCFSLMFPPCVPPSMLRSSQCYAVIFIVIIIIIIICVSVRVCVCISVWVTCPELHVLVHLSWVIIIIFIMWIITPSSSSLAASP